MIIAPPIFSSCWASYFPDRLAGSRLLALDNYYILIMTTRVKKKMQRPAKRQGALDLVAIGRRIRELRGFDIQQADFARMLEVSQSQLSKYERGESEPPLEILVKLRERFGKSLDWLVIGEV
jgi:predicted transcriptional regulator